MKPIFKTAQEMGSLFRTFDSAEEAAKIADFFNSQVSHDDSNDKYRFRVMKFKQKEAEEILEINRYLEKPMLNNVGGDIGGYYIAGVNEYSSDGNNFSKGNRNYSVVTPVIFTNENNELVFSKMDMDINVKKNKSIDDQYGVSKIGRPEFVMPNPYGDNNLISTLDGKVKASNQILRTNVHGVQTVMNADYVSVAENLFDHIKAEDYGKRNGIQGANPMSFLAASSYATRHQTGISGKTITDATSIGMVKGTEGQNLGSTNSYTVDNFFITPRMMEEYNSDFEPLIDKTMEKVTGYNFEFEPNGDARKLTVHLFNKKEGHYYRDYSGKDIEDVSSSARFKEYYNNKVSLARNSAAPNNKIGAVVDELNSIMDEYSYNKNEGKKASPYVDRLKAAIINAYDGDRIDEVNKLFSDDGVLSRDMLTSMVVNGRRFHDLLDVNRQSINTNDSITPMSGAIMDLFGSFNKIGQRNAQSDAKMSKAIIRVNGENFNMSSVAKSWGSGISEMAYKNISYGNTVAEEMIGSIQENVYGEKLNSEYYSQQSYMLQTFHNGAFQDSNIIAADLALENISKYDSKNSMFVSYNALTPYAVGDFGAVDYSKLNNENAYVDGTIENTIFRNLLGEERYSKHIEAKANLVKEYENVGRHLNGITNLQSLEDRKKYATAYNEIIGETNQIMEKYMYVSDSKARVQIFDDAAVAPGQFKHLTGVNFAHIEGIDFSKDGIRINTSGIINHGDSVKFMNGSVKSTTQAVLNSLGIKTANGYVPVSGLNNEKMLSKKRGFTGELLERTLTTLAFNYTTMGNSDSYEDNFNAWKKAMTNDFTVDGINGSKVNLFEALGVDVSFKNNKISFTNIDTKEALGGYDLRTKGLSGSINKKIHGMIEDRALKLFGIDMADYYGNGKGGKQFTDKLFSMLSDAEDGLSNMIVGEKNGLSQDRRRGLMSILQRGELEAINMSQGSANVSNLGAVKGLRLLNNIHIMQETKSRAESEGLSLGRLTMEVARESGFEEFADVLEKTIAVNNVDKIEPYVALSGAMEEYRDLTDKNGRAYTMFSNVDNLVNLKDKTLRYNIDGVNTTLENYMANSPLGEIIRSNMDEDGKGLKNIILGTLKGFDKQFLDVASDLTGARGVRSKNMALGALTMSEFAYFTEKKNIIDETKMTGLIDILKNNEKIISSGLIEGGVKNNLSINRLQGLSYVMSNFGVKGSEAFYERNGLNNINQALLNNVIGVSGKLGKKSMNFKNVAQALTKDKIKYDVNELSTIINFANSMNKNISNVILGEQAVSGEWDLTRKVGEVSFTNAQTRNAKRMLNSYMVGIGDASYDSDFNMANLLVDRIGDYTGYNAFNLKQLADIASGNELRYILDEVSTDESGVIINKSNLSSMERLIKLNSDLALINDEIESLGVDGDISEKVAKTSSDYNAFLKGVEDRYKKLVKSGDKDAIAMNDSFSLVMEQIKGSKTLIGGIGFDESDYDKLSVYKKMDMINGLTETGLNVTLDYSNPEIKSKIQEILKLKEQTFDSIKSEFLSIGENGIFTPNSSVSINKKSGNLAYGVVMNTVINDIKSGKIKNMFDLSDSIEIIDKSINISKGPNVTKHGINASLDERNTIRNIIQKHVDGFFSNADFSSDREFRENVLSTIEKISAYDISDKDAKTITRALSRINDLVNPRYGTLNKHKGSVAQGLASAAVRGTNFSVKNKSARLVSERDSIKADMLSTIKDMNKDLSENFFRKAGVAEGLASTRFKNSVEFSPMEKTISSNYLIDEFNKVVDSRLSGGDYTGSQNDLFKAMKLVYGNEVVDDIIADYDKAFNETTSKFAKVEEFRKGLQSRVEEFSGIVIGTRDDFENAGLGKVLNKNGETTVRYGFLSRNPHQYQGSLRATRYVALDENDRNLSFLKGLFGDGNKISGTQGHLGLIGKRTAISAHGDHDGDKFQALITGVYDFIKTFGGNKKTSEMFTKRHNNNLAMYQLLADYKGNLRESIKSGNLSKVESGIIRYAREAYSLGGKISNEDVFDKIEHIYYSQKMERIRTSAEVMDENMSHAEIAFFKKVKGSKTPELSAFEELFSKMKNEDKLNVLASTFGIEDMKNIDRFFDKSMLNDPSFVEKINKIKSVSDNRYLAQSILDEFGIYGIDKIKFNNVSLSESSYAAYTGISRTGSIHYDLTNIRDSAASMFSKTRMDMLSEAMDERGFSGSTRKSFDNLINGYVDSGRFWMPINELDELIDKLAISSKLGDGSNPYQKVAVFKNATDKFTVTMEKYFRENGNVDGLLDFSGMKNAYKSLADNAEGLFDYNNFISTGGIQMFSKNAEINKTIDSFIRNQLFKGADEKISTNDLLKASSKLKNSDVMKAFGNVYTMFGQSILSVSSGILSPIMEFKDDTVIPNPYARGRTTLFQKGKNFLYGMGVAFDRPMNQDGYNPTVGVFGQFKKLLKNSFTAKTGGNSVDPSSQSVKSVEDITNMFPTAAGAGSKLNISSDMVNINKAEKRMLNITSDMVNVMIPSVESEVVEDIIDESERFIWPTPIKRGRKPQITAKEKRGRRTKVKTQRAEELDSLQQRLNFDQTTEEVVDSTISSIDSEKMLIDSGAIEAKYESKIKELENQINDSSAKIEDLQKAFSDKDSEFNSLQNEISSINTELENAKITASEAKEKLSVINKRLDEVEAERGMYKDALNKNWLENTKNVDELKKEIYRLEKEHKDAINNLNFSREKTINGLKAELETAKKTIESQSAKISKQTAEASELRQTISNTASVKSGTKATFSEIGSTIAEVGDNAKKVYNNHKKFMIGAGVTAVLGTAFSLLQRNRPIVDVDIREEEYERSQGSVYRNLGTYTINTNIRSIR